MGVAGSGKSTVGALLAAELGLTFVDADSLHPPVNIEKMTAGVPLTDEDRWPWLDAVGEVLASGGVVVACSALRRRYRDRLRGAAPGMRLVYLEAPSGLVLERMALREHFMPSSLVASQVSTLEPPTPDEQPAVVASSDPLRQVVRSAIDGLDALDRSVT